MSLRSLPIWTRIFSRTNNEVLKVGTCNQKTGAWIQVLLPSPVTGRPCRAPGRTKWPLLLNCESESCFRLSSVSCQGLCAWLACHGQSLQLPRLGEISLFHIVTVSHSHPPELGPHFTVRGITWLMSIHLLGNRPH